MILQKPGTKLNFDGLAVSITNYCNFQCKHCYSNSNPLAAKFFSHNEIMKFIEAFSVLGIKTVFFGGGEPLSHNDLPALIGDTIRLEIIPSISTNGTYVSHGLLRALFYEGLHRNFHISIDGSTEQINDAIRGQGSFNIIERALSCLCEFKEINFTVNIVVNSINYGDVENILRFCKSYNPSYFNMVQITNDGRANINWNYIGLEKHKYLKLIGKISKNYRLVASYYTDCMLFSFDNSSIERVKSLHNLKTYNGFPAGISIDADGNIQITPAGINVGNLYLHGLSTIIKGITNGLWDEPYFSWLRERKELHQEETDIIKSFNSNFLIPSY